MQNDNAIVVGGERLLVWDLQSHELTDEWDTGLLHQLKAFDWQDPYILTCGAGDILASLWKRGQKECCRHFERPITTIWSCQAAEFSADMQKVICLSSG